jgi:hypothetical protein
MGWYFRKSKSVGPFRVNFSKSGMSFSTGIKGARMSFGPRGTFVNVGGNGIYYRKKLGSSAKSNGSRGKSYAQNGAVQYVENYAQTVDAITVQEQTQGVSVTNQAIVKDIKRARLLNWLWVALSVILLAYVGWWTILIMLALRVLLPRFFRAEVNYDMDTEAANEWEKLAGFFSVLKTSKKLWVIETSQSVSNTKTNAGAGRNLTRSQLTLKQTKANRSVGFGVFSNSPCFKLKGRQCTILFLPCDIIIKKGKHIVACSYENLNIHTGTTNFIETDPVPKDAAIVRYTWQFVNKDGSADRRYANNRQLPVCQYGRIMLQAGDQIGVEIHVSNAAIAANIGTAFQYYADYLEELSFHNQAAALSSAVQDESVGDAPYVAEIPAAISDHYSDIFESAEESAEQNDLVDEMMMFLKEE